MTLALKPRFSRDPGLVGTSGQATPTRSGERYGVKGLARLLMLLLPATAGVGTARAAINIVTSAKTVTAAATSATITMTVTGGDTVVVIAAFPSAGGTVSSITDTGGSTYSQRAAVTNTVRAEIWSTGAGAAKASTSITVNSSASVKFVVAAADYSGVAAVGANGTNTGSTATPTISITTQDANNWVAAGFAGQGTATPTANTGNLRQTGATSGQASNTNVSGTLNDNTAASAGSVTNAVSFVAGVAWAAAAVELRSTVPPSGAPKRLLTLGVG